jgi:biotin carboxyl carrier protein
MRRYTIQVNHQEYTIDVDELEANQFRVLLNGQNFQVNLSAAEELAEASISPAIVPDALPPSLVEMQRPTESPKPMTTQVAEHPSPVPASPTGVRKDLVAPMPGTILEVQVKPGDNVKRGDTVAILEAMKMKNAIKSPRDGVISHVMVEAGQTVKHGDALVRFEESA